MIKNSNSNSNSSNNNSSHSNSNSDSNSINKRWNIIIPYERAYALSSYALTCVAPILLLQTTSSCYTILHHIIHTILYNTILCYTIL